MATSRNPQQEINDPVVEVLNKGDSRSAAIWESFDLVLLQSGKRKARCMGCQKLLTSQGNSTLVKHLGKSCPAMKNAVDPTQPELNRQGGIWNYDAELNREMIVKCIIQEGLPFGLFDNPRLTKMIKDTLQPRYKPVSRQTIRRDAIKMWKLAQTEMKQSFSNFIQSVALTCDVWSAPHGLPHSYICITAHWIDVDSWQMLKRVITFEPFGSPHTSARLFRIIKKSLDFYGLTRKIISISFDNASNNTGAIPKLKIAMNPILDGAFFHTRCVAHIINLAVQHGMTHFEHSLLKFRQMLKRIFASGKKVHGRFRQYCFDVDHQGLGPNFDMPTRWNSTYYMLQNLIKQKDVISAFYKSIYPNNSIRNSDWKIIEGFYDLLEVFKNATTLLSGVYYPTSHHVLNQLYIMICKIEEYESDTDFDTCVSFMKVKLWKYFEDIPLVFTCAAALNPFFNVTGVEVLIRNIANVFGITVQDPDFASKQISRFREGFENLYDIYKVKFGSENEVSNFLRKGKLVASSSSNKLNQKQMLMNLFNDVQNETSKKARFENDSGELNSYIRANFIQYLDFENFDSFDILAWWQQKQPQFPVLAAMARDLLTIQASTVASESAFSLSGRIISVRRTRLSPESVECCVCLKDYLDGVERIQNQTTLEMEIENVEELIEDYEIQEGLTTPPTTDTDNTSYNDLEDELDDEDNVNDFQDFED